MLLRAPIVAAGLLLAIAASSAVLRPLSKVIAESIIVLSAATAACKSSNAAMIVFLIKCNSERISASCFAEANSVPRSIEISMGGEPIFRVNVGTLID